jgi:hypothetical protein
VCSRGPTRDDAMSIAVQLPGHRERRNRLPGEVVSWQSPDIA